MTTTSNLTSVCPRCTTEHFRGFMYLEDGGRRLKCLNCGHEIELENGVIINISEILVDQLRRHGLSEAQIDRVISRIQSIRTYDPVLVLCDRMSGMTLRETANKHGISKDTVKNIESFAIGAQKSG